MAQPRAFISFDFDNNEAHRNLFAGQCSKDSPTPFSAQDWSSKEALPSSQWEVLIENKIGRCNFLVVLVSPTAYRATGVAKEIEIAQNVPYFGVYVAGANSATSLPPGLQRNRCIDWDWSGIAGAVSQVMREGKNA
jgi:hypothetical protein